MGIVGLTGELLERAQAVTKGVEDRALASPTQEQQRELRVIPPQMMIAMDICLPDPADVS